MMKITKLTESNIILAIIFVRCLTYLTYIKDNLQHLIFSWFGALHLQKRGQRCLVSLLLSHKLIGEKNIFVIVPYLYRLQNNIWNYRIVKHLNCKMFMTRFRWKQWFWCCCLPNMSNRKHMIKERSFCHWKSF